MKNTLRKIARYLPAIVISASIVFADFSLYYSTLAINHSMKEAGGILPTPTLAAIAFSKYHLSTGLAILCLLIIGLIEWKIKERSKKLMVEIYIISMLLVVTAVTFFAMSLPFICLCDAWKQW